MTELKPKMSTFSDVSYSYWSPMVYIGVPAAL